MFIHLATTAHKAGNHCIGHWTTAQIPQIGSQHLFQRVRFHVGSHPRLRKVWPSGASLARQALGGATPGPDAEVVRVPLVPGRLPLS